ncbi:hypothetical protein C5Y44_10655 [Corynebacterium sp. J010B-136]|nr:hypothetical protein C5Y44_10655 [Corynebacterium sp. J010B-136]
MNSPRIFSEHESKGIADLLVYSPGQSNKDYALAYHESAKRLAGTFKGQAGDDLILLPFLALYRQAFELQLKLLSRI